LRSTIIWLIANGIAHAASAESTLALQIKATRKRTGNENPSRSELAATALSSQRKKAIGDAIQP
jgi:hypothetical protein